MPKVPPPPSLDATSRSLLRGQEREYQVVFLEVEAAPEGHSCIFLDLGVSGSGHNAVLRHTLSPPAAELLRSQLTKALETYLRSAEERDSG